MSKVAIYQPVGAPLAILSFAPGVDPAPEAARIAPDGVPFWVVSESEMEELYAEQGEWRNAWLISEDAIGRAPDGFGGGK